MPLKRHEQGFAPHLSLIDRKRVQFRLIDEKEPKLSDRFSHFWPASLLLPLRWGSFSRHSSQLPTKVIQQPK